MAVAKMKWNAILFFKSNFELSKINSNSGFLSIFGGFDNSGLYLKYPPENKQFFNLTNYEKYYNYVNPSDCRDKNLKIPDYFYFKCINLIFIFKHLFQMA